MSDQPTPETPERDSWRQAYIDLVHLLGEQFGTWVPAATHSAYWDYETWRDASARRDALLAVEDKHPPVFHIRPLRKKRRIGETYAAAQARRTEWRWVAERNGRKLYGSTESYEHRQHAIDQAHDVADPLGARVLDDEGNEV
jgi:hypothetical protein